MIGCIIFLAAGKTASDDYALGAADACLLYWLGNGHTFPSAGRGGHAYRRALTLWNARALPPHIETMRLTSDRHDSRVNSLLR